MNLDIVLAKEQNQFLDIMPIEFGLKIRPPPLIVEYGEDKRYSALEQDKNGKFNIRLDSKKVLNSSILDGQVHELSHYLHFLTNPIMLKYTKITPISLLDSELENPVTRLLEFVAELGTLKFRAKQIPNRERFFQRFVSQHATECPSKLFLPAYCAIKNEREDLLSKLAMAPMKEGVDIVDTLIKRYGP